MAANGKSFDKQLDAIREFYDGDFDWTSLSAQLESLSLYFAEGHSISLKECIKAVREMTPAQRSFFSEICRLLRLILIMPATNAASERSFSAIRRLKTYLRSTMAQSRLNHIMILSINKEKADSIDLGAVGNEFVGQREVRLRQFGPFV